MLVAIRRTLILLAVTAAVLAAFWTSPSLTRRFVAFRLAQAIESLPDQEAVGAIWRAAELGSEGFGVLAEGAGSPRAAVARAAQRALLDHWDRLESLPAKEAGEEMAMFARALSEAVDQYGPASRRFAADLASQMLHSLAFREVDERLDCIAECQHILDTAATSALVPPEAEPQRALAVREPDAPPVNGVLPERLAGELLEEESGAKRLPVETARVPALPQSSRGSSKQPAFSPAGEHEPRLLPQRSESGSELPAPRRFPKPFRVRRLLPDVSGESSAEGAGGEAKQPAKQSDSPARPNVAANTSLDIKQHRAKLSPADLMELSTADLLRLLGDDQAAEATAIEEAAVEAELEARGFGRTLLNLARRLTDEDPHVRLELIAELPQRPDVDSRTWLLWLTEDQSAEVRLAALSTLATTGDPQLRREIEQRARHDRDERIRSLARRLQKQRLVRGR